MFCPKCGKPMTEEDDGGGRRVFLCKASACCQVATFNVSSQIEDNPHFFGAVGNDVISFFLLGPLSTRLAHRALLVRNGDGPNSELRRLYGARPRRPVGQ